jgi:polysaccharide biosynthesis transport protein
MAIRLKTFDDYLDFVKRRKYYIAVTWIVFGMISVVVAYYLPKTFRSTATLLIESPIPAKILENMPLQFADEQLQSIYQRVMTTDNVYYIIESTGIYDEIKEIFTKQELVEFFKKSTEIELAASALNAKTGSSVAEIAFNISFSDSDPNKAEEIANQLANIFIDYNNKARSKRAGNATEFLQEESDKLSRELEEIDRKVVAFKEEHNFSLPEQMQGNLASLDRAEVDLRDTESQIRSTKERIVLISAELSRTQSEQTLSIQNNASISKEDALEKLRDDYLKATQIYQPSHPTLQRLKREIKALTGGSEEMPDISGIANELAIKKQEISIKEKTYSSNHPEIIQLRNQIVSLEKQVNPALVSKTTEPTIKQVHSRNPAYLSLETQYKSSHSELESLYQKQVYLKSRIEKLHATVSEAPLVEKGYNDLARERDGLIKKYNELKEKLADAKVYQTLEEGQQGQSITMLEAPVVPVHPERAIRRKVAIGGFFAGLLIGCGLAFVIEALDPAVRGYRAVTEITGIMPTVVLPYIESPDEEAKKLTQQRRFQKMIVWTALILTVILSIVAVSFFSFTS